MVLLPHWPYGAVRATRWTTDGALEAVISPGFFDAGGVVDVAVGPEHRHWVVETSLFEVRWPVGFAVASSHDPEDHTPFYLRGPGEATIYPQGPVPRENVADPYALVGPEQIVVDRRPRDGGTVVELAYEHGGVPWWQGHWVLPFGTERCLVLTAQSERSHEAQTRAAAEATAASLRAAPAPA
jgi:hypothetical protein